MNDLSRLDSKNLKTILKNKLTQFMPDKDCEYKTNIPFLTFYRRNTIHAPKPNIYQPVIIVIIQGSKWVQIGNEEYIYGEGDFFITGIDLPVSSGLLDATTEKPYLSLSINLDKSLIREVASKILEKKLNKKAICSGSTIQNLPLKLLDAISRLVELLENPNDITLLSPLIIREIYYRLLTGAFGNQLISMCAFGTQSNNVANVINWLRNNFAENLDINSLAVQANMSPSSFHKHFKKMTGISPIQYQKRLRLIEAKRLMIELGINSTNASMSVGYESQSQFSREYKRLFGESPMKHIKKKIE